MDSVAICSSTFQWRCEGGACAHLCLGDSATFGTFIRAAVPNLGSMDGDGPLGVSRTVQWGPRDLKIYITFWISRSD